jgi:hypothetical protein
MADHALKLKATSVDIRNHYDLRKPSEAASEIELWSSEFSVFEDEEGPSLVVTLGECEGATHTTFFIEGAANLGLLISYLQTALENIPKN